MCRRATPVVTDRTSNLRRPGCGNGTLCGETDEIAELGEILGGQFGGNAATTADPAVPVACPSPNSFRAGEVSLDDDNRKPSTGPDLETIPYSPPANNIGPRAGQLH
jgi:hypothetical protein